MLTALPASAAEPLEDPIPDGITTSDVVVELEPLVEGLTSPLGGVSVPAHRTTLYVVDQTGQLWAVDVRTGAKTLVLDVSDRLVELGAFGPGTFDERGFLGVAFDPGFRRNGLVYTYTSEPVDGPADYSTIPKGEEANHQAVVTVWRSTNPKDPAAPIDRKSARELLRVDEPQFNHNAGALAFDHAGYLLIAFGDGGGADDQGVGHGDSGNGQDLSNPLGAILRIDPHGTDGPNGQYGIPKGNPFVGVKGALDEIFAYGFRNPFRMSVDTKTGDIYVGDVGQNDIEEVDVVRPGGNYGWPLKEGSFFFDGNGADPGFVTDVDPGVPTDLIDPVAEYDHDEGVSVIGGFVYRGRQLPDLRGEFVFGEFAQTFSNDGRLFATDADEEAGFSELRIRGASNLGASLLGFGQDARGEMYVMTNATIVPFGDTGIVWRIRLAAHHRVFSADLAGPNEVPPVVSEASGAARIVVNRARTQIRYAVNVHDLHGAVASHIHLGAEGENGPPVAFLFSSEEPIDVDGRLARGVITAGDLIGPLEGMSLVDLIEALETGNAYVNVHTVANPPGEIRGQLMHR
jgi:glucose/arabinose dehydrogenase